MKKKRPVKARRLWNRNPKTQIVKNRKKYNRKRFKNIIILNYKEE
jgi:hypothetical protein